MMERVRTLRAKGCPPKAIARAVGLPLAKVERFIKIVAEQAGRAEADLVGCWVSPGWSAGLTVTGHPDWPDVDKPDPATAGKALVLVARAARPSQVTVCGYLVDVGCLGVKDALGPRKLDDGAGLYSFRRAYFRAFKDEALAAPLELARHLVFGALEYARGLGFEPHPDFAAARAHLGQWSGTSDIEFGRDGMPYYVSGPYDNVPKIMGTLRRSVGEDNFQFLVAV